LRKGFRSGQQLTDAVGNFTATYVAQNEAERLRRSQSTQEKVMTHQKKFSYQAEPLKRLLQITDFDSLLLYSSCTIFLVCSP
jgi:hypothetical protein